MEIIMKTQNIKFLDLIKEKYSFNINFIFFLLLFETIGAIPYFWNKINELAHRFGLHNFKNY